MTISHMAREVAEIPQAARRFLDLSAGPLREAAGVAFVAFVCVQMTQ